MRVFIGTFLGPANQAYYRELAAAWCRLFPRSIRAVPPDTVHVTYAFLPRVDDQRLSTLSSAIRSTAAASRAVTVVLEKPGVLWGGRRVPRLVEARIGPGATEMIRIARSIQAGVNAAAPELELSPAKAAHVTLARFRRGTAAADARRASGMLGGEVRPDELRVVSVIASQLTPAGPVYRVLAAHPLAGQRADGV